EEPEGKTAFLPEERGSRPSRETKYALVSEKQPGIGEGRGLVLVESNFSLGKRHKICSLELITEEWWLDFFELENNFFALRGMDSPIDESDLGSLSHRRTSLKVKREGNRKGSPSLCLLLVAFLIHPALRRLQIQLQIDESMELSRFLLGLMSGAFFLVFNSSPARFELSVVGRPSRFASSRPAKKVKGSGQRVRGHYRTA
nr:hypothetical protein [Tanacetum cinerariifolium]